jgi:hypothetical protein
MLDSSKDDISRRSAVRWTGCRQLRVTEAAIQLRLELRSRPTISLEEAQGDPRERERQRSSGRVVNDAKQPLR